MFPLAIDGPHLPGADHGSCEEHNFALSKRLAFADLLASSPDLHCLVLNANILLLLSGPGCGRAVYPEPAWIKAIWIPEVSAVALVHHMWDADVFSLLDLEAFWPGLA